MRQGQAEQRFLKVSEVAKIAGCSADTVRAWANGGELPSTRTPGNQRRFLEADVARFLHGRPASAWQLAPTPAAGEPKGGLAHPASAPPTKAPSRPWPALQVEPSPLEVDLADATVDLELARIARERESIARSMQQHDRDEAARLRAEAMRQEEERARLAAEARLEGFRRYGRECARDLPTALQAQVTADLATYVCTGRFPASLADADAWAYVRARVELHRSRFREAQARAAEAERLEREQVAELERRESARKRLIGLGKDYAFWETLRWDSDDKDVAAPEVERELGAAVAWDWNEEDVKRLVDEVLDELSDE